MHFTNDGFIKPSKIHQVAWNLVHHNISAVFIREDALLHFVVYFDISVKIDGQDWCAGAEDRGIGESAGRLRSPLLILSDTRNYIDHGSSLTSSRSITVLISCLLTTNRLPTAQAGVVGLTVLSVT